MWHIFGAIGGYILFNVAIWLSLGMGGLIAMGGANMLAAIFIGAAYHKEIRMSPNISVAALGSFGILAIVIGLRESHRYLPVTLSMEAAYNGFACLSWPLFLGLRGLWPRTFQESPSRFDLLCHGLMASLVALRFYTYGAYSVSLGDFAWVGLAIFGYAVFNVSLILAKGNRTTNIAMNLGAGSLLVITGCFMRDFQAVVNLNWAAGLLLGGIAIFVLVKNLGMSYAHFGSIGKNSLVAPLVYDGILIASPVVMIVTKEQPSAWTLVVAAGMIGITTIRYRYHMRPRC